MDSVIDFVIPFMTTVVFFSVGFWLGRVRREQTARQ